MCWLGSGHQSDVSQPNWYVGRRFTRLSVSTQNGPPDPTNLLDQHHHHSTNPHENVSLQPFSGTHARGRQKSRHCLPEPSPAHLPFPAPVPRPSARGPDHQHRAQSLSHIVSFCRTTHVVGNVSYWYMQKWTSTRYEIYPYSQLWMF